MDLYSVFLEEKREKDEKRGKKVQEKSAGGGESRAATLFDTLFSF